jgi:hypothetical protein
MKKESDWRVRHVHLAHSFGRVQDTLETLAKADDRRLEAGDAMDSERPLVSDECFAEMRQTIDRLEATRNLIEQEYAKSGRRQ